MPSISFRAIIEREEDWYVARHNAADGARVGAAWPIRFTAIIEREGGWYVALCPELDIASQGKSVEEATANLKEAVELFLESADSDGVTRRVHDQLFVTRFEVSS